MASLNRNTMLLNAAAVLVAAAIGGYFVRELLFPAQEQPCAQGYENATQFVYERSNGELFTPSDLQARFGRGWGIAENTQIVRTRLATSIAVLEIAIPKGSINPSHPTAPKGGVGFRWRPSNMAGAQAACLAYSVWLPEDFDFKKGGKLPGLFGGSAPAGGAKADGRNGFSARYMWRDRGHGEVYAYVPGAPEGRGQSIDRGKFSLDRGKWTTLIQEVVLNDPGQKNGKLKVWVNGELSISRSDMHYRDVASLTIDGVMADVFYGGSDPSYAAPKDTRVRLTPFEVRWR